MTDEQFIEWLWKIQEHCDKHECEKCIFCLNEDRDCQIEKLTKLLNWSFPNQWDMEEIERIIRL